MKRMALTICAVLGLQAGPVWAATNSMGSHSSEAALPSRADGAKPAARAGAVSGAPTQTPSSSTSTYATREAAKPELARFKGGSTSLYIGGSTLVIVLLVVLLIVLL